MQRWAGTLLLRQTCLPIAATNWILRINTDGTTNQQIDFSKIKVKDIVIRFTYTFGNPPEFPNF